MTGPRFAVGIDLGTTNSALAYTLLEGGGQSPVQAMAIRQLTAAGVVEARELLPSAILVPAPHELPLEALRLPWGDAGGQVVGCLARDRGAELPHRMIASAKSWLCHDGVDRRGAILPWNAPPASARLSPVEASAAILAHLRQAWNHAMASGDSDLRLERQAVYLAVPASFDPVARQLTLEAATAAGLPQVTLLEEPLAAFYAWLSESGARWRQELREGDRVLVCDVGGGTTDFSLVRVAQADGVLTLEREAVGDHLLVGGDNMDLALAHLAAAHLAQSGTRLDGWQMRGLWHACREAKERLLEGSEQPSLTLSIAGRGSRLIGGALSVTLDARQVRQALLDGFFPVCGREERPLPQRPLGLQELGLAYAADPAITRQLAAFLARQVASRGEAAALPTAVLFNGGVMKAEALRGRVLELLADWSGTGSAPRRLASAAADTAVARGAAAYGLARHSGGVRIRAGLAKSYYIGVAAAMPAVPGLPAPQKALCVAPCGLEEGSSAAAKGQAFLLTVGERAAFTLLCSAVRRSDRCGEIVEDWSGEITPVTTLETLLDGAAGTRVPVEIEAQATEVGTLAIWCVAPGGDPRWKLEFNVRERESGADRG